MVLELRSELGFGVKIKDRLKIILVKVSNTSYYNKSAPKSQ